MARRPPSSAQRAAAAVTKTELHFLTATHVETFGQLNGYITAFMTLKGLFIHSENKTFVLLKGKNSTLGFETGFHTVRTTAT